MQISDLKYSNFDFNLEEGRNIKILWPKYQNMVRLKISKYRLYRRRFLRGFRHFSAFFAIYLNILEKMRQNVKKCKNPSHQISEIFRKWAKNGNILIFWLYFILWYFAWFLHFHFEICENVQPVTVRAGGPEAPKSLHLLCPAGKETPRGPPWQTRTTPPRQEFTSEVNWERRPYWSPESSNFGRQQKRRVAAQHDPSLGRVNQHRRCSEV